MGLYTDTRIVNATLPQVYEMIRAQKKARDLLITEKIDEKIVSDAYASFTAAVLGLVFYTSVPGAIAFGFISLITSLNSAEKAQLKADLANGLDHLQDTYIFMNEGKWVKTNMTLTESKERPSYAFGFIKSRKVNSYTDAKGISITY